MNWHPSITQEVSKLQEMAQKVDVAKAKYYPQISAGMNNGYTNTYSDAGYTPSLVVSVSQMLYDFGKVSSSVRAADSGVAQQQATVMLNIDQVAHDTAAAVVQCRAIKSWLKSPKRRLTRYSRSAILFASATMRGHLHYRTLCRPIPAWKARNPRSCNIRRPLNAGKPRSRPISASAESRR